MTRNVRWTNFNYLTYKYKRKRGHAFDVMLGQETAFQGSEYLLAGATDFPFDNIANDNLGLGATPTTANLEPFGQAARLVLRPRELQFPGPLPLYGDDSCRRFDGVQQEQ